MKKKVKNSAFSEMQKAVDVVNTSLHPENKIAASLFGTDKAGRDFSIAHTNYWPAPIRAHIGTDRKIGNSSGTIHAETACILNAPYSHGASLCITDPFCPNCAKNIAEAGIKNIYIDHKGLDKDWIERNRESFDAMSLRICARAGINVYKLGRKAKRITPLYEVPEDYQPLHENPVDIGEYDGQDFKSLIRAKLEQHEGHQIAITIANDESGKQFLMTARRHATIGYSRDVPDSMESKQGKYSFILQPVNRLLMNAPRHGLTIVNGSIYSSRVPTAREQVNMVGAGLTEIHIGHQKEARDDSAFKAMKQLSDAGIINFHMLD